MGYQRDPNLENTISGTAESPRVDDTLIQMTGICYGGTIEVSANKAFMHLQVKDYMDVLKKQFIFNSPFFDGCSAHLSIYQLAKMAGFDDCTERDEWYKEYFKKHNVDRRPLGFMQKVIDSQNAPEYTLESEDYQWNGEKCRSAFFRLPITYASLANPAVRFPNGETYDNCMKFIAKQAGDIVYFDRYGVLKYEKSVGLEIALASDQTTNEWYKPKVEFFTSPLVDIPAGQDDAGGSYDTAAHQFTPDKAPNLIYNVYKYSRDVESCINQIVIATAVPDALDAQGEEVSGFYYLGHCFYDQLFDPNASGFLGFRKAIFVSNGVYGGKDEAKKALEKYAAFTIPTSRIEFETFGMPCLKPHDVISVNGNLFYITEISHDISPADNKWWMSVSAEWMRPYRDDLGLYKDQKK